MVITVCVGNACHVKGSKEVVQILEHLIQKHGLIGEVDFNGSFCIGDCNRAVCVKVDEELFSVNQGNAVQFFYEEILAKSERNVEYDTI